MSSRMRHLMKGWSIRASWILGLLGLLCWVDFVALEILVEQEFLSQEGHDHDAYESIGSPYLPLLVAGCLAFMGALLMLALRVILSLAEFLGRLIMLQPRHKSTS
ncbi:hypothetical protein [Prosthecobacter dejongeii]|uniref:Uncharacterized protein n=1 Tax=Prosthecobacter dejongeii TaxID=48465 RepID=A0A7W7YIS4_9BACT|nr:hypothetical protein [Prosthecobacter dejongeii]MBB5036943.1 hypothetical protein [Prosthecobacter dejongeii]